MSSAAERAAERAAAEAAWVARALADAPPLSDAQRWQLVRLLSPYARD